MKILNEETKNTKAKIFLNALYLEQRQELAGSLTSFYEYTEGSGKPLKIIILRTFPWQKKCKDWHKDV